MKLSVYGNTTARYYAGGWCHTIFTGSALGHEHSPPHEVITRSPYAKDAPGSLGRDAVRCDIRLTPGEAQFREVLDRLARQDEGCFHCLPTAFAN